MGKRVRYVPLLVVFGMAFPLLSFAQDPACAFDPTLPSCVPPPPLPVTDELKAAFGVCPDGSSVTCNTALDLNCKYPCAQNHPDDLLGIEPVQPPCPEGAGFVPPGWLGSADPFTTGCVWLTVPKHLRDDLPSPPLSCFLDETLKTFEVWSTCSPFDDPTCVANCRDLQIIDGIATSPPSLAGRGAPLRDNFGTLPDFITNQRIASQVVASCGFEGEFWSNTCVLELDECKNPPLPPAPPPGTIPCDNKATFFDGNGGNLWKPKSDNDGQVVALTKGISSSAKCELFNPDGSIKANCRFNTIANGNREHWRSIGFCSGIQAHSIFRLTDNGVSTCFDVTEPCSRLD